MCVGLLLFAWFVIACGSEGGSATSETSDPLLDATVHLPVGLAVGNCVRIHFGPPDAMDVTSADCADDASETVIAIVELDDGDYPGPAALTDRADAACGDAFEATGISVGDGEPAYGQTQPTPGDWSRGERRIVCYSSDPPPR